MVRSGTVSARTGEVTVEEREPTQAELDQSVVDQAEAKTRRDAAAARVAVIKEGVGKGPGTDIPSVNERIRLLQVAVAELAEHVGLTLTDDPR